MLCHIFGSGAARLPGRLLAASAAIFLALASQSPSRADGPPAGVAGKLVEASGKLAALWADPAAKTPVIVEFAMPALPDAASFATPQAADDARTAMIHGAQDAILRAWLGSPATVAAAEASPVANLKRMAYTPLFGVVASAEDVERLSADPRVVRIHEDRISDPLLIQSRSLIGMDNAYIQGATGNNFHVAILDTGGRRSHEFLSGRIVSAACYSTTDQGNGSTSLCPGQVPALTVINSAPDCDSSLATGCSHGTHVAGIAAGFNTNQQAGEPSNGVARDARIISINVFSLFNNQASCGSKPAPCVLSFSSDQIKGLERIYTLRTTRNIGAVTMSLGGGQFSAACDGNPLKPIIDLLRAARIATVIAAGNDGFDSSVGAPGCISSAITVASSTKSNVRSGFSNWGTLVDVVAPGSDILSSYLNGGNIYASLNGTSTAAPHVAGAITALRSARPWATIDQIEAALKSTGLGIASAGVTRPRIRVDLALNALPPENDNFAGRTAKVVGTTTGFNNNATAETGEPIHAGRANARNSVWWTYTPTSSGQVTINTTGSSFDTVLAVYTGAAIGSLTPVASNDDIAPGNGQSRVTFQGMSGTSYAIAVAGDEMAFGAITLNVAFVPTPPPANDNFANRITIAAPGTVTGSNVNATAEIGEPYHGNATARTSVWWRYTPSLSGTVVIDTLGSNFDTVLAVSRGSELTSLSPVDYSDNEGGTQQSRVSFEATVGTSYAIAVAGVANATGAITLTVSLTPPTPANDNFANRVTIIVPRTVTGTNLGSTAETGEPSHAGVATARNSVWWRFTLSTTGPVIINTAGSGFDTVLAVYTGNAVGALTPVASNDNTGGTLQSQVTFEALAGTSYAIAVAGKANATGPISLSVTAPTPPPRPVNDDHADAVTIFAPGTFAGSNVNATPQTGEPNHAGVATARTSVWWQTRRFPAGPVVIHTAGSGFDTVLAVYTGSAVGGLTLVAADDNTGGTLQSQVAFEASAFASYYIAVAGKANATGPISLTVLRPPPPTRPANDNHASRIPIVNLGTAVGSNVSATAETGEPIHAGVANARTSVWWRITPTVSDQIVIRTAGSGFDTVLAVYTGDAVGALTPIASNDDFGGTLQSQVTFRGTAGTSYAIAVAGKANATGPIALAVTRHPGAETTIFSAVSPVARATVVGGEVTAFASVINAGSQPALSCSIGVPGGRPLTFSYRSRNQQTGALGPANQPVNVAVGAREDFVMFFTPTGAIQQELALIFDCTNTLPATSVLGLNTFLLTGTTGPAPADLISIAVTPTNDGIMNVPLGGTGFAALAALNIGGPATIQARLSASSILSPTTSLPATMVVCQTNATTGACLAPPAATVSFTVPTGQTVTMTAFVASNGTAIPFDPAGKRLFVHFFQGTIPVGSASVAARTVAPDLATLAAK